MDLIFALILAFLEISFITVGLLILHGLRHQIGKTAFYIAIGALFIFIQIVSTAELRVIVGYQNINFYIANSVLFMPLLAAVMLVYITEGTLATQRLITGTVAVFIFYIYLSYVTSIQCSWTDISISQGPTANSLDYLLARSLKNMSGSIVALIIDLFLIPIFFQRLRNLGARMFYAITGALMLTQIVDSFVSLTVSYWNDPQWLIHLSSTYLANFIATIWLSIIITLYLTKIEKELASNNNRKTLDIIFAFLGNYGRAKVLQRNIMEWEGRYRMVIENVSDMILIINRNGKILDVNPSTLANLNYKSSIQLINRSFINLVHSFKVLPCQWEKLWEETTNNKHHSGNISSNHLLNKQLTLKTHHHDTLDVEAAFSKILISNKAVLIVVCRNISERKKLIKEKNDLKEQLYHAQRVESLGRLAGGIAHEFNNILHALQGHIDIVLLFSNIKDESAKKHLNSVMDLVEKASEITSQLLGFARKSQYEKQRIDLKNVLSSTREMFQSLSDKNINISMKVPRFGCFVKADSLKLQQIFLNLLINAMDAIENNPDNKKNIQIVLQRALSFPTGWKPIKDTTEPNDYYQVTVKDNGIGMDEKTVNRIFEPFYTTKEVGKGTGMGMAIVYGEITNHKGFIHVKSEPDVGTEFFIYLPVCLLD